MDYSRNNCKNPNGPLFGPFENSCKNPNEPLFGPFEFVSKKRGQLITIVPLTTLDILILKSDLVIFYYNGPLFGPFEFVSMDHYLDHLKWFLR